MKDFIRGSAFRRRAARLLARKLIATVDLAALYASPIKTADELIIDVWKIVEEKFLADSIAEAIKASGTLGLSKVHHDIIVKAVLDEVSGVMIETMPFMEEAAQKVARNLERFSLPPAPAIDWSKAKTGVPIRGKAYLGSDSSIPGWK